MGASLKPLYFVLLLAEITSFSPTLQAQEGKIPGHGFVGSWRLRRTERIDGSTPVSVPNAQGMIVFDSAGHVIEIVTEGYRKPFAVLNRPTPEEALEAFNTFAGLWGSYRADEKTKTITYHPEGAVNPSLMGQDLKRTYDLDGDRLVIMSTPGESNIQGVVRWTWQRVPPIENLSAEYRKVVGFWAWVSDKVVNLTTGETISEGHRAPSVIVYAPSGYCVVHFVPGNRKPLQGHMATGEEAKADIAGYIGYTAILTLHSGWVVHHEIITIAPGGNSSLDRMYEAVGDELHLKFPPTTFQGQLRQNQVIIRRLSGEREMVGE
jgi:Lipocalin-like domain